MWIVAAADWQDVLVALITLAGVVFNGFIAVYLYTHVRTPSHRKLGELVEETHTITAGQVVQQLKRIEDGGQTHGDAITEAE